MSKNRFYASSFRAALVGFALTLASFGIAFAGENPAQNLDENGALPRATPESVGISSDALTNLIDYLDKNHHRLDSLMVLRDGKVVCECWRAPQSADAPHALYSLSKSFTSTAAGFAVAEGKLSIDQKIVDIFPDEAPAPAARSENLNKVTIADLLSMSCGHDSEPPIPGLIFDDAVAPKTWVETFLAHPVPNEPGTKFVYNTAGTYMVSAAVQKAVGENIRDYLVPRLFEPLHIDTPYWENSPQGVAKGGTGLYLKTEDIAKFGQFYLQRGVWNGEQLLPAEWVDLATSFKVSNGSDPNSDWAQGYCFQFWRCRHNVYRGDGMHCQFCVVAPDQNIVVAMTSDAGNYQLPLDGLWDILLPAAQDAPLPENPDALAKLREKEKSLQPQEAFSGSAILSKTIASKALGKEMRYRVYIPNEYRTTSFQYPVLYLLHGYSDDETSWSADNKGRMKEIVDAWFAEHPFDKAIIVMPDAEVGWYRDSKDDSYKYETYFFDELIPAVEKEFRCKTDRNDRAVAGLSMGGYGALLYALRRPDMFRYCYSMSPAVRLKPQVEASSFEEFVKRYRSKADQTEADPRFDDYYYANDPYTLLQRIPEDKRKDVLFFVDSGDDDSLTFGASLFHLEARTLGVPCEYRVRDGAHNWEYWRVSLVMALDFIAQNRAR